MRIEMSDAETGAVADQIVEAVMSRIEDLAAAPSRRDWMNRSELAEYLGIHPDTVTAMKNDGRIPADAYVSISDGMYRYYVPRVNEALMPQIRVMERRGA